MSLREIIDKHPKQSVGIIAAIAVFSLTVSLFLTFKSDRPISISQSFFTDDDGKTWFVDSADRLPPFDHNGKTAVRALLFTCSDHKGEFVGYLERYSEKIRKRLETSANAVAAGKPATLSIASPEVSVFGTEVKLPGKSVWVGFSNFNVQQKIKNVPCPGGGVLDSVVPQ